MSTLESEARKSVSVDPLSAIIWMCEGDEIDETTLFNALAWAKKLPSKIRERGLLSTTSPSRQRFLNQSRKSLGLPPAGESGETELRRGSWVGRSFMELQDLLG